MKRLFATFVLRVLGWRFSGDPPALPRYVLIAAPHTSNLDGVLLVAMAMYAGVKLRWMVKDSLVRGPLGVLLRATGALPINRRAPQGLVGQVVDAFRKNDRLVVAIPPEGTRRRVEYWKSGFYAIAREANVPLCLGYLDYSRKTGGFGPVVHLTGDVKRDMDALRAFYAGMTGRREGWFGPVRLRAELEPDTQPGRSEAA